LARQVKTVLAGPPHFSAHPKGSIEATAQKPGPGPADQGRVVQRVRACLHVVTRGGSPGCWTADRPGSYGNLPPRGWQHAQARRATHYEGVEWVTEENGCRWKRWVAPWLAMVSCGCIVACGTCRGTQHHQLGGSCQTGRPVRCIQITIAAPPPSGFRSPLRRSAAALPVRA
jgi:hypothetical protein